MISRHHASLVSIKNILFLTDLGSTNGTFVNTKPIAKNKKIKLRTGDIIKVGSQKLKVT